MNTCWRRETSATLQPGKLGLHWPLASAVGRDLPPQAQRLELGWEYCLVLFCPWHYKNPGDPWDKSNLESQLSRVSWGDFLIFVSALFLFACLLHQTASPNCHSKPWRSFLILPTMGVSKPLSCSHLMVCLLRISPSIPDRHQPPYPSQMVHTSLLSDFLAWDLVSPGIFHF